MKSYLHVYTGEGKGKTTAALGLTIRAAGAGHKVFLAQFIKGGRYSELNALKRFDDLVTVEQFGRGRFMAGKPSESDIIAARNGLKKMKSILSSGDYNVVILDEATSSLDTETEALLHEAMHAFLQNRTTLIIAHRLSAVRQADRVLVFDAGKIIDEGHHHELISRDGLYRDLYGSRN